MITMDGKYYRRGDEQKRPVRVLCVDAAEPISVVYLDERSVACRCRADGDARTVHSMSADSEYDLLPIPSAPSLVPWTSPQDVPCPCWIKIAQTPELVIGFSADGEMYTRHGCIPYAEAADHKWAPASNSPETDWKPCGKVGKLKGLVWRGHGGGIWSAEHGLKGEVYYIREAHGATSLALGSHEFTLATNWAHAIWAPCDSISHGKQLAEADYAARVEGLFEGDPNG